MTKEKTTNNKVFLGGTCNNSTWREKLIPMLNIDYFNPVVEDWTPECQKEEERQKDKLCNYHLYVITPKMTGVFSIAEVVESAINKGDKCIFCFMEEEDDKQFDKHQRKSLEAVGNLVSKYKAYWADNLDKVAKYLNNN
jgi:hypothetical protein